MSLSLDYPACVSLGRSKQADSEDESSLREKLSRSFPKYFSHVPFACERRGL